MKTTARLIEKFRPRSLCGCCANGWLAVCQSSTRHFVLSRFCCLFIFFFPQYGFGSGRVQPRFWQPAFERKNFCSGLLLMLQNPRLLFFRAELTLILVSEDSKKREKDTGKKDFFPVIVGPLTFTLGQPFVRR